MIAYGTASRDRQLAGASIMGEDAGVNGGHEHDVRAGI